MKSWHSLTGIAHTAAIEFPLIFTASANGFSLVPRQSGQGIESMYFSISPLTRSEDEPS